MCIVYYMYVCMYILNCNVKFKGLPGSDHDLVSGHSSHSKFSSKSRNNVIFKCILEIYISFRIHISEEVNKNIIFMKRKIANY